MIGKRFVRLVVLSLERGPGGRPIAECVCDCGAVTRPLAKNVRNGTTKSCGCLRHDVPAAMQFRHGDAVKGRKAITEYTTWTEIRARCRRPTHPKFPIYGGRGIFVCDRWRESYENFLADMGRKPHPEMSIDRIDNNGPYSPGNCRWATRKTQANNTRQNVRLVIGGAEKPVTEWASISGVPGKRIRARIRRGWDPQKAVFGAMAK